MKYWVRIPEDAALALPPQWFECNEQGIVKTRGTAASKRGPVLERKRADGELTLHKWFESGTAIYAEAQA